MCIIILMTTSQLELYAHITQFAVDTVLGWISTTYRNFGPKVVGGDALIDIVLKPAEQYFNYCAAAIYSRTDDYINERFDKMCKVQLENENHPIDCLQMIVMLSMYALQNMAIGDVVNENYDTSMRAVRSHIVAVVGRKQLADTLHGCVNHNHLPIGPGEKIFDLAVNRKSDQSTKLSTLQM